MLRLPAWSRFPPSMRLQSIIKEDLPMRWALFASIALGFLCNTASAVEPSQQVTGISAYPAALKLKGMDDAPQLLITGKRADGREIDLTQATTYRVSDPKVIRIEANGRVFPSMNG